MPNEKFILLNEMTRKDILNAASPEPWQLTMRERIQGYVVNIFDVELDEENERCVVTFRVSHPSRSIHDCRINLKDFWIYWELYEHNPKKLRNAIHDSIMEGDIYINCSCPSWIYGGYKYMATQLDYILDGREDRFPKVRNPRLLGTMCKHLFCAVTFLPNNEMSIVSTIKRKLRV